ncbi:hypothetical protein OG897_36390 [Streptomyces sp. NBC_00237]|uniref:CBS domain-containing protein n=1 Tax=Streptomyces sp. NBC_00237 TaxID=2975687 RepID=UPI0022515C87|nr:CBS domain-containing protein [Streptomyces sp. NBC_00237]MCX5206867.1 hypothetical protein [Streptomyces sp. NBC_00237]
MRAWVVRAGRQGEREPEALEQGLAIAGWSEMPDLSASTGRADIQRMVRDAYPEENDYTRRNWTGQLFRFRHEMTVGDLIALPRMTGQYAIGHVAGAYTYQPDNEEALRHIRPVAWARKDVPREAFRPDLLQSLGSLLTVFELRRFDAARRIGLIVNGEPDPGRPDDGEPGWAIEGRRQLMEQVRDRESGDGEPVTLTVRKLLELWNAARRNSDSVARIRRDLDEAGLLSVPPFTEGTLDSRVTIFAVGAEPDREGPSRLTRIARSGSGELNRGGRPDPGPGDVAAEAPASGPSSSTDGDLSGAAARVTGTTDGSATGPEPSSHPGTTDETDDDGFATVSYLVGNLPSASVEPLSLPPAAMLSSATTLMLLKQLNYLPVVDEQKHLLGAVTWASIGQALMGNAEATLADATAPAPEVAATEHLLDCMPQLEKHGYVFVRDDAHRLCGLVTPADIAAEFRSRVSPFVLIEEVEQRLRRITDRRVSLDGIRAHVSGKKKAAAAEDARSLTLGNYPYLFRDDTVWKQAGLAVDQQQFAKALERCAALRNELMHFSPDPVTDDDIVFLNGLLDLLRKLDGWG